MDTSAIGKKVFLEPTGNLRRRSEIKLAEAVIVSIKRKYFYVQLSSGKNEKFEIETLRNVHEDCNSEWMLWFSEEEYDEYVARCRMIDEIRCITSSYLAKKRKNPILTCEEVKRMYEVLHEPLTK